MGAERFRAVTSAIKSLPFLKADLEQTHERDLAVTRAGRVDHKVCTQPKERKVKDNE
jgi:hypothetical protein